MGSFAERHFSLTGVKLAALEALQKRSSQMGWWRMVERDITAPVCVGLMAARHEECDPRWMIEKVIRQDCANGASPAQVMVRKEEMLIAMVETDVISIEQLEAAAVQEDGKSVVIEGVAFEGFPDGKRNLRVVLAFYDLDDPSEWVDRVQLQTLTADGTYIL